MTSDVSTLQTYAPRFKWELKTGELNVQQRRQARAMLFGQFGQKKCFFTDRPIVPQLLHDAYDLHHLVKRGSPGCNFLINLRLALHGPNANAGKQNALSGIRIRDKQRIPLSATETLRQTVPYDQGSAEMKANGEAEVPYRAWLWERVIEAGSAGYPWSQAINSGAEHTGVSPQATRDYLNKATSDEGPFFWEKVNGVKRVFLRKGRAP